MSTLFSLIWPIDRTVSGATTPGQRRPVGDGNKGVLHIHQSSSITGASLSDCFSSYSGHSWVRGLTPQQRCSRCILPLQTPNYCLWCSYRCLQRWWGRSFFDWREKDDLQYFGKMKHNSPAPNAFPEFAWKSAATSCLICLHGLENSLKIHRLRSTVLWSTETSSFAPIILFILVSSLVL